uniref:Sulfotransferase domain-containing protein n=1 Tax=Rhizochromulina marina TaxID=1034831 RepID=A0A7S2SU19_9STRA
MQVSPVVSPLPPSGAGRPLPGALHASPEQPVVLPPMPRVEASKNQAKQQPVPESPNTHKPAQRLPAAPRAKFRPIATHKQLDVAQKPGGEIQAAKEGSEGSSKKKIETVTEKRARSDKLALENLFCPDSPVVGAVGPRVLKGVSRERSQGKECVVTCQDKRCSNGLDACAHSPQCTHLVLNSGHLTVASAEGLYASLRHLLEEEELREIKSQRKSRFAQCVALGRDSEGSTGGADMQVTFAEEKIKVEEQVKRGQAAVLLVHIHKAGGTTLCNIAKQIGLQIPPTPEQHHVDNTGIGGKNCNPGYTKFKKAWSGSVEEQLQYIKNHNLQFFANEKYLAAELPFGKVAVMAVLRHPYDRLLSEAKHTGFRCRQEDRVPSRSARREQVTFERFVACNEENMMVRRICGCRGNQPVDLCRNKQPLTMSRFDLEQLPLNQSHLECAKTRLSRFSLVLVTEFLEHAPALLSAKFGWKIPDSGSRGGTKRDSDVLEEFGHEPSTMKLLRARHAMDLELYEFAKSLNCREMARLHLEY